jgi:cell division protein FtsB
MFKFTLLVSALLLSFTFTACVSKAQTEVTNSNSQDVSDLLRTLIQKEKEINDLNQKLEDCRNSKVKS